MSFGVVVCNDDTSVPLGQHKHKCGCGTTWFHDMSEREAQTKLTSEAYNAMHNCPSCGSNVRTRYFHTEEEAIACHTAIKDIEADILNVVIEKLLTRLSSHSGEF